MSTLDQLKDGLTHAWDSVSDGWRGLLERASDALTRFHPKSGASDVETHDERIAARGARWGLLAAEVKLDDDNVEIDIEVPGMDPDDFEIRVVDDLLVIRGEKKVERERRRDHYHVMERAYGAFERAVRLPVQVDESSARAAYNRGVLQVTLPRLTRHKTRRIEVRAG